jgi:hypothetical protein
VLAGLRPRFDAVLDDPARHRFQILVTEVRPGANDGDPPQWIEHGWRVDAEYVYPASAIKTFASLAALRRLQALRSDHGKRLNVDTPLAFCSGDRQRCRTDTDESNVEAGTITLRHELRKMQLVSNNTAFNRLSQFVGMDALNRDIRGLGFDSFRLLHPLWTSQTADDPVDARVELRPTRGKPVVIPTRPRETPHLPAPFDDMQIGRAYIDDADRQRVDEPMDFSVKNYVSVRDFHRLTMAIARTAVPERVFPEDVPELGLDDAHARLLRRAMEQDPLESENPVYEDPEKTSMRYKPLLRGLVELRDPKRVRYLNKAGRAYGFHLENAWIRDRKSKVELFVTMVIYVNDDDVLNDDRYGYDATSKPLLTALGEALGRAAFDAG